MDKNYAYFLKVVQRAVDNPNARKVLLALYRHDATRLSKALTIREIASITGIPQPTVKWLLRGTSRKPAVLWHLVSIPNKGKRGGFFLTPEGKRLARLLVKHNEELTERHIKSVALALYKAKTKNQKTTVRQLSANQSPTNRQPADNLSITNREPTDNLSITNRQPAEQKSPDFAEVCAENHGNGSAKSTNLQIYEYYESTNATNTTNTTKLRKDEDDDLKPDGLKPVEEGLEGLMEPLRCYRCGCDEGDEGSRVRLYPMERYPLLREWLEVPDNVAEIALCDKCFLDSRVMFDGRRPKGTQPLNTPQPIRDLVAHMPTTKETRKCARCDLPAPRSPIYKRDEYSLIWQWLDLPDTVTEVVLCSECFSAFCDYRDEVKGRKP